MGTWHKTQCNFCGLSCGLEMEVEDNKIISVRPDPDSSRTHGYCCRKGRSSKYFQDNEERLDYPLKRVGDHFERITWEQATREIAEKTRAIIDKHGPRAFGYCGGALASGQADAAFCKKMMDAIGSQNYYNPVGLEFAGNWWSHGKILGTQALYTEGDEEHCDVLIFWGSNSYVAHNFMESRRYIRAFSENPDKMIIDVDPRMSETARMADLHIMPRPGTDSLLLRGLISLIVDKGWQDQRFLDKWCTGWNNAAQLWFRGFDYRAAFEVCRVPCGQMEKFARILTTKTWGLHQDLGIFCGRHNTCNSYLLLMLMAVTGNLLRKGNTIIDGYAARGVSTDESDPSVWRLPETGRFPVLGIYPTGAMAPEILSDHPDRMRAMFVSMSNPARSWPDSKRVAEALDRLELLVVIDIVMSETARHADYVLPGKTGFETYEFNVFQATGSYVSCMLKHPIIGQIGERKENTRIWFDIVDAMGYIPELPQSLYDAAEKAMQEKDRIPYLLALQKFMKSHTEYAKALPLIICKSMLKPMGSINRTMMWAALITSPLMGTGMPERAGFGPGDKHKILTKIPKLRQMAIMDQIFQAVDETPQGVVCALPEPDPEKYTKAHIYHKDKRIHLWCAEIDQYIRRITPEKEAAALDADSREFPLILSSGRHADGGDNTSMRNPDTYRYRKPYMVTLNPEDAEKLGLRDGQEVKVTTKGGSVTAPLEISCQAGRGYALIPHHFGLNFGGKVYGSHANELTRAEDLDELTGNPLLRYVPCRVEAV